MDRVSKWFGGLLAALILLQSLTLSPAAARAREGEAQTLPIRANALFGTNVRGGSYADMTPSTGSSTVPRELIEAKWAGDASYSRRSHMEFDLPKNVNWENVSSIKLTLYLHQHSGSGKRDTIQVFKTDKPAISEENWTWNATAPLMDSATVIGEQTFTDANTGSWVEIDVTPLKDIIAADPDKPFALALYPKAKDDQGGIRFYSPYQEAGKYTPYLNIYETAYNDTLPPSLQVSGLTDGMKVTNEALDFQLQASDNNDSSPVIRLSVNGEPQAAANGNNTVLLKTGNNVIELSAEDAAGNRSATLAYNVEYSKSDTFPVIADTFTDIRYPSVNYNGSTDKGGLQLKTPATGSSTRKVYLSYDLTGNTLQYVKKADIQLYLYELMGTDRTSEIVSIYEVPDFDETKLTWGNAPENGEKVGDVSYSRVSANTYVSLDITSYINKKLAEGKASGRLNFMLTIENGHDQKGVHITSKERNPDQKSKLILVEGLPAPTLEVTGIEDGSINTAGVIPDVSVKAGSVSSSVAVDVVVKVGDSIIASKGEGRYDIPLSPGANVITVIATDQEGNKTEARYSVTRLNALEAGVYYVDSAAGSDQNDGLSEETPWKSLHKLNDMIFQPGSKILFKRGSIWNGQFRPNGAGTVDEPIVVDTYGQGARPIINGNGISNLDTGNTVAEGAVHLYNISYWDINGLEVTNEGAVVPNASRVGIMVVAGGNGFVNHVHIRDVYVHNVNSHDDAQKISGGIIFRGDTMDEKGNVTNVPSGFRDILVENSHIKDVAIEGLRTKTYKNGADTGSIKNEDVVFRNNLIENILGDGLVISEMASGGLVEKNIIRRHSMSSKARNYAGLWFYQTDGVIAQYNEVYDGVHGYNDGEAFDFDIGATNNIYQYNYSHNNRGGFLLTMTSAGAGNVFRYNVSQNDGNGEEIFFCMNDRTAIYNNTIYVGEGVVVPYLINETNIQNMFFKNNILHVDGEIQNYSRKTEAYTAPNAANNLIYPASVASLPGSPNRYDTLVTGDPLLTDPSADNVAMESWTQHIWDSNIAKFKLLEDSPAIDSGAEISNPGAQDLYGTPLFEGDGPDIGANEFAAPVPVTGVELSEDNVTLNAGETYQAAAEVLPSNATNKAVSWSSLNPETAVVDANGLVTAKAPGTTKITVKTVDGNQTDVLTVTVASQGGGGNEPAPIPTPSPSPAAPAVETDKEKGTVTSILEAVAAPNGSGKLTASVNQQQMEAAVEEAKRQAARLGDEYSPAVEIRVAAPEGSTEIETTISKQAWDALSGSEVSALKLTSLISIAFDERALASVQSQGDGDLKIRVAQADKSSLSAEAIKQIGDRPVFDIEMTSGNAAISQFDGIAFVTIPYTVRPGENINALLVYYLNGALQPEAVKASAYDAKSGMLTFKTGHFSRYAVGYHFVPFLDVAKEAWYSNAVSFAAARGITQGTGTGQFGPEASLTRAQFLVLLMRAYDIAPDEAPRDNFADAEDAYYTGYLAAAKRLKLSAGIGGNRFAPNNVITREEMMTLLYQTLKLTGELPPKQSGLGLSGFSDAAEIAEWAIEAMTYLVNAGIVQGSEDRLNPTGDSTRAQMVKLLHLLLAP